MDPVRSDLPLPEAPGARGARTCGILAIVLALTCVGIPVAIVLGIVALVLQAKAKRLAREAPEAYRVPTQTGLVTGIIGLALPAVMLPFVGIISAIAIPALLGQRERAREKTAQVRLMEGLGELVRVHDQEAELGRGEAERKAALEARIAELNAQARNPWNPQQPAYAAEVEVLFGSDDPESAAQGAAVERGQAAFRVQFPRPGQAGFLAGAVRTSTPGQPDRILTKVTPLGEP